MPPSDSQAVEELAQKKTKYEMLYETQAAELRKDPKKYQEAYDRVSLDDDIFKPGQQWIPNELEKGVYMKRMEDICQMNPTSFDDRVKISFAAHGILLYIVLLDMSQLSTEDQLQILKRSADLHQQALPKSMPSNQIHLQLSAPEHMLAVLKRPPSSTPRHRVTADELNSFDRDSFQLIGRQFMLDPQGGTEPDGLIYEVVGVRSSKVRGKWYEVQLEGCVDPFLMDKRETMDMMTNSVLFDI